MAWAFGIISNISLPNQRSWRFPMFSSRCFIFLAVTLILMIYFEFCVCVYCWYKHLLKTMFSSLSCLGAFVKNQLTINVRFYFWTQFYSIDPQGYFYANTILSWYCNLIVSKLCSLKNHFGYSRFFHFHINLSLILSLLQKILKSSNQWKWNIFPFIDIFFNYFQQCFVLFIQIMNFFCCTKYLILIHSLWMELFS